MRRIGNNATRSAWSKLDAARYATLRAYVARVGFTQAATELRTTTDTLRSMMGGGPFQAKTIVRFAAAIDRVTGDLPF